MIRDRSAEAVSSGMFALTVTAFLLWSAYGLMLRSWPLMVSNLLSLVLASAILLLKVRFGTSPELQRLAILDEVTRHRRHTPGAFGIRRLAGSS